jgi:5'-nucleotidase
MDNLEEEKRKPQILLTNDDGIQSPGLWSAAEALSEIGFVHVAAPRDQYSGGGRSMPSNSNGIITPLQVSVHGKDWTVHSVGGSPAQAVLHAVLEILPHPPDLVVSGINYGENVGTGITISGTVGAALEAASLGIPALAVSLETEVQNHLSYSENVAFTAAAYFTAYFARLLLKMRMPEDVHVLKVDIPSEATMDTPWEITRVSRKRYYEPYKPDRENWDVPSLVPYRLGDDPREDIHNTDVYTLRVKKAVSVTPLSLDLTSRVRLEEMENLLRNPDETT